MPRTASTHVDDPRAVGRRLREAREAAGISQRKLAFAGCTSAYISRIEAGQRIPSLQLIHEFARRLRVTPEWLATGVEGDVDEAELLDAEVALRLGEHDDARDVYERRLAENPDDPVALAGLGALALRTSEFERAIELLEHALEQRQGRLLVDPSAVESLARAYAEAGAVEAAIALLDRAVAEAERAEAIVETLRFKVLLANALVDRGDPRRAELILADTITLAGELRDPIAEARVYWSQSRLHCYHNDPRLGARYARKAIEILERTENQTYVAMAYHVLACAELEAGDAQAALEHLEDGRVHFGEALTQYEDAKFAIEETRALLSLDRVHEAARRAARALDLADVLDPRDRARTYAIAADVFRAAGDVERALDLYGRSLDVLEEKGGPFVVETATRYSELLEELGRTDEALAVLRNAVAGSREHEARASRR